VLSIATCVTPASASQSPSTSSSSVIVPNVRTALCAYPSGPGAIMHATAVFPEDECGPLPPQGARGQLGDGRRVELLRQKRLDHPTTGRADRTCLSGVMEGWCSSTRRCLRPGTPDESSAPRVR
jgi:hypothetical protein